MSLIDKVVVSKEIRGAKLAKAVLAQFEKSEWVPGEMSVSKHDLLRAINEFKRGPKGEP